MLACSVRTVHELARTGGIPHRRPPGTRRLLFRADEILAWLDGATLEITTLPRNGRIVRPQGDR
jgi:excisionase family DNA binding protein